MDRTPPSAPSVASVPENAGGGINAAEGSDGTTVNITLPANAAVGDTITLLVGGNPVTYVITAADVAALSAGVPVTASLLAVSVAPTGEGTVNLTVTLTDAAGNTSAPSAAFPINVDLNGPAAPTIASVPENTAGGINALEASDGTVVNVSLAGTGAKAGDVLSLDWGGQPVSYTLTATDITNNSAPVSVSATTIATRGSGTYNLTTTLTDGVGNVSPPSTPFTVKVDITPPFAPTITSIPENSGGGINAAEAANGTDVLLSLAGTGAEARDTVNLNWGGQPVAYTLTAADILVGSATILISATTIGNAGDGTIPIIVASITDMAKNPGPESAPFSVVVDTTKTLAPVIASIPEAGGGIGNTEAADGTIVNVTLPAGTVAGDTVTLSFGGQIITYILLAGDIGSGNAPIFVSKAILEAVAGGPNGTANNVAVTATVTDQAGNVSDPSANFPVNIDFTSPAALTAPDLAPASDSGASNTDNITSDTTPTMQGTGAEPGATVTLYDSDGTTALGTGIADGSGNWSITPATALSTGVHNFTTKQTDTAGNQGSASAPLAVTVDTNGPTFGNPAAVNEGFASTILNATSLGATDNVSPLGGLDVVSAVFKSSSTFVVGDVSFGAPSGGGITMTRSGGADKNGTIVVTVSVRDAAGNITTQDVTLTVNSVNDAPAGTNNIVTGSEDTPLTITTANFGFTDVSDNPTPNALLGVKMTTVPGSGTLFVDANGNGIVDAGEAVAAGATVSAANISAGNLKYLGAANANGTGTGNFTFQVQDNGGTANGGVDIDGTPRTMTVNVTAVNDAPTLDASKSPAISTPEYVFSSGGDAGVNTPSGTSPAGSASVSTLVASAGIANFVDVDGTGVGLGVTALTNHPGATLWYTTTAGGANTWNWTTNTSDSSGGKGLFGADGVAGTSDDRVLQLGTAAGDKVIFDGGNSGLSTSLSDGITFRAWDQSTGTDGSFATNPSTGGSTAYSTVPDTIAVNFTTKVFDLTRLDASAGVRIQGNNANAKFGWDVTTVGDVNKDGFDDFVIAENGVTTTGKGASYLYYGQAGGYGTVAADGTRSAGSGIANATFNRGTAGETIESVSNLGDINNDGFADFIMAGKGGTGSAYIIYGGTGIVSQANLDTITPSQMFKVTGVGGIGDNPGTVSGTGDVNGDGYNDLVIGARLGDPNNTGLATADGGMAFVVYGHAGTNFGASNTLNLSSFESLNYLASNALDTGGAAGHVLDAGSSTRGLVIGGGVASGQAGSTVSGIGDLNGDGYSEFALSRVSITGNGTVVGFGNLLASQAGNLMTYDASLSAETQSQIGVSNSGYSHWVLQKPTSVTASPAEPNRYWSQAVGDVNGDGLDDMAMGYNSATSNKGEAYVLFGSSTVSKVGAVDTLSSGANGFKIIGAAAGDFAGNSIRGIGDFNGDGYDDFVIGAPRNEVGSSNDQGGAYIIYGGPSLAGSTIDLSTGLTSTQGLYLRGSGTGDQFGFAVSGAGDVNGDGLRDVLIGAPLNDQGATDAGTAYLLYGNTAYGNSSALTVAAFNGVGNTAAAEKVVGTSGNDILTGSGIGFGDAVSTGAGNDVIVTNATTFLRIDGGTGTDTLRLNSTATWDFTLTSGAGSNLSGKVRSIEQLDLGTGNQTVKLTAQDVLQMSEVTNDLRVTGTAGDTIDVSEVIGAAASQWHNLGTSAGVTTYQYFDASNAATLARLLVDSTVTVS